MRRPGCLAGGLVLLVALAGCSDDMAVPPGNLHGATAATDGESVWVAGGTVVPDEVWSELTVASIEPSDEATRAKEDGQNHLVLQYDGDGTLLQTVDLSDLDVRANWPLTQLSAGTAPSGTVLAAPTSRKLSRGDTYGYLPLVISVTDGRPRLVTLDVEPTPQTADAPTVRVVGTLGDEVFVAVGAAPNGSATSPSPTYLFAVDPPAATARAVPLPPATAFAEAMCVTDGRIAVATQQRDADGNITSILAGFIDPGDGTGFAPTAIERAGPRLGMVTLLCLPSGPVVVEHPDPNSISPGDAVALHEASNGGWTTSTMEPQAQLAEPQARSLGDSIVMSVYVEGGGVQLQRWTHGELGDLAPPRTVNQGDLLALDDRLLDVSRLLLHTPGGDAPAPLELDLP